MASPRTRDAKKRNQSFLTSAGRFVPPRDVVVEETDPENPGEQNLAACIDFLQQLLSSCGGVSSFELLLSCPPEQTISSLLPVGLDTAACGASGGDWARDACERHASCRTAQRLRHRVTCECWRAARLQVPASDRFEFFKFELQRSPVLPSDLTTRYMKFVELSH